MSSSPLSKPPPYHVGIRSQAARRQWLGVSGHERENAEEQRMPQQLEGEPSTEHGGEQQCINDIDEQNDKEEAVESYHIGLTSILHRHNPRNTMWGKVMVRLFYCFCFSASCVDGLLKSNISLCVGLDCRAVGVACRQRITRKACATPSQRSSSPAVNRRRSDFSRGKAIGKRRSLPPSAGLSAQLIRPRTWHSPSRNSTPVSPILEIGGNEHPVTRPSSSPPKRTSGSSDP